MKITRQQLSGLIRKTLKENTDELASEREKLLAFIQSGNIEDLRAAVDLNDMLGVFDKLELEKIFWQKRMKDSGFWFPLTNIMLNYLSSAIRYGYTWSAPAGEAGGFSQGSYTLKRGPGYEGTIDNLFNVILNKFLGASVPVSGVTDDNGEPDWEWIENKPSLVAVLREGFDEAIKVLITGDDPRGLSTKNYYITELLPASEPSIRIIHR